MRIPEQIDLQGFWWIPDKRDTMVAGRLHITTEAEISLELLGQFGSDPMSTAPIPILHGMLEKGKLVTLVHCHYVRSSFSFSGIATARLQAYQAFFGHHFGSEQELCFSKVHFHVEGLDKWLGLTGIKVEHDLQARSATITYSPLPELQFPLDGGSSMGFTFSCELPSFGSNIEQASVTQKAWLCLKAPTDKPFTNLSSIIYRLTCLLCIAMNETTYLTHLECRSDIIREQIGTTEREVNIEVYGQSAPQSQTAPKLPPFGQLFIYHQVKDRFAALASDWLRNFQTIEPSFNLYFAVTTAESMFLENQFIFLVQGLETFHRRTVRRTRLPEKEFDALIALLLNACPQNRRSWLSSATRYMNEPSLRQRLEDLLGGLSKILLPPFCGNFPIDQIVDTQNYLTHYDVQLESKASTGKDLLVLVQTIRAAFALLLLHQVGFTDEELNAIAGNCQGMMKSLNRQI